MMRFLGYLFFLLIIAAGALFGAGYYLDRQASAFVVRAVEPIYANWNFDALKLRAAQRAIQHPAFEHDSREMFRIFGGALGPLKSAAEPSGGLRFGWKSDAEIRGLYADYTVQATFESGEARLEFVVVKEGGAWRIVGFRVDSPTALDAVSKAIAKQGPTPSFEPGSPEDMAIVKASAGQTLACLDSDAVARCWERGSRAFKQTISKQKFTAGMAATRAAWGVLQNRRFRTVEFMSDMPEAPPGHYAGALFESTFSRVTVDEGILFYKQDGEWVFSGYRWNERR